MARFKQSIPAVSALYFQRSSTWLNTFFFLVSGVSLGVFTELFLPADDKLRVGSYLMEHLLRDSSSIDHSAVFVQSTGGHLALLVLIFLSGLTSFGVPATLAAIAWKGTALGFSAALLIESMELRGVFAMVLAVVPPHLLILPALFLAAASAVNRVRDRRIRIRRKKSLSFEAGPYCMCFLLPLLLILIAGLWESFISPALLQLIK